SNACGILSDHTIHCWGGSFSHVNEVPTNLVVTQVDLGDNYACAVTPSDSTSAAKVTCWGNPESVFQGPRVEWEIPQVTEVSAAANRYYCIRRNGAVGCQYARQTLEPPFAGSASLVSFVACGENMCGLDADGKANCFGFLDYQPPPNETFVKLVVDFGGAFGL